MVFHAGLEDLRLQVIYSRKKPEFPNHVISPQTMMTHETHISLPHNGEGRFHDFDCFDPSRLYQTTSLRRIVVWSFLLRHGDRHHIKPLNQAPTSM
jgi:hypothetical protein